jgi:hypothetical protein
MKFSVDETALLDRYGTTPSHWKNQLGHKFKPLGYQLGSYCCEPSNVAIRSGKACHESALHRITANSEDHRNRRRCTCRGSQWKFASCDYYLNLSADQIGVQLGQPIIALLRPTVFDSQIFTRDETGFLQSLVKCDHEGML